MLFEIVVITSDRVCDTKGRMIPSVMVRLTDNATLDTMDERIADDQEQVMLVQTHVVGRPTGALR